MKRKLFMNFGLALFILSVTACAAFISACSLFGNTGGKEEDSHTHSLTHTQKKDPTCTENGNIEYWYCDGCHK